MDYILNYHLIPRNHQHSILHQDEAPLVFSRSKKLLCEEVFYLTLKYVDASDKVALLLPQGQDAELVFVEELCIPFSLDRLLVVCNELQ